MENKNIAKTDAVRHNDDDFESPNTGVSTETTIYYVQDGIPPIQETEKEGTEPAVVDNLRPAMSDRHSDTMKPAGQDDTLNESQRDKRRLMRGLSEEMLIHLCCLCRSAPCQVLFMPCRHCICCDKCSLTVTVCPECKTINRAEHIVYVA